MLSVVITPAGGPGDLAFLLARLTPAVVEGLVREAFYAGAAAPDIERICEAAGVDLADSLKGAEARARGGWLLVAPATFRPADDWQALAAAHMAHRSGRLKMRGVRPGGLLTRAATAELRPRTGG